MIKINEVCVPLEYVGCKEKQKEIICNQLNIKTNELYDFIILKKSIDARKKNLVHYKFNYELILDKKIENKVLQNKKVVLTDKEKDLEIELVKERKKVLVVGSGPSGIFAALTLAKAGLDIIVVERGEKVEDRIKTVEKLLKKGDFLRNSNIQFGEGGAGTFSDGKLNTGINSPIVSAVLKEFVKAGAPEEILYDARPHVGTDRLRKVVYNMRENIKQLGGRFFFNTKFVDYIREGLGFKITVESFGNIDSFNVDYIVFAVGYSARDTLRQLYAKGIEFKQKAFSVGYRIEHLQENINKAQYGTIANMKYLPPADYKLFAHLPNGRTVYTFCMCPGGQVVPAMSDNGEIVTNGMSNYLRDGKNSNSAVLVSVSESDYENNHPLAGMKFQENLERNAYKTGGGKFICTKVGDFLQNKPSLSLGEVEPTISPEYKIGDVGVLLPKELADSIREGIVLLGKKLKGFDNFDAVLTGIETRSSAPFMICRNKELETSEKNIYAIGEGAGMAGGIVSSAVDGIKIALKIIEKINGERNEVR